ncbi:MAG: type II toxin-antitoxin system VapC family toxin, partial [Vicinamibacteraceae bacterium]
MRLLLDTHAFLWWVDDDNRLSRRARAAIADRENDCFLSLTSCWELAIKVSLGKLSLEANVEQFVSVQAATNGFTFLPVQFSHTARVARLPFHHRDPFDRMLAAQA